MNLIFSGTLELGIYISMAIVFRRLEEIAERVESNEREETKIKSSGPPMMTSKFRRQNRTNNEISLHTHSFGYFLRNITSTSENINWGPLCWRECKMVSQPL